MGPKVIFPDGRMDRQADRQTDGLTDGRTDGRRDNGLRELDMGFSFQVSSMLRFSISKINYAAFVLSGLKISCSLQKRILLSPYNFFWHIKAYNMAPS